MSATGYTGNPPGSGGGGGSTAWADITGKPTTFPPSTHSQAASTISDSTTVGRAVLTAADAAAGRTALSAEASGAASTTVTAHVALSDPHTQYALETDLTTALALKAPLASPTFTGTVAGISKAMVGLGSVDNTTDAAKPVSTAGQTALDLKAPLASPALTGNPTAPTQTAGNDTTRLATTAFVTAAVAAGGGGGGTAPTFARAVVTSGNVAISADATWMAVTGLTLTIAAVAGDDVSLSLACLISHTDSSFYELAVLVGGSPVRYASTLTSSPAGAAEGDPSMYPLAGGALHPLSTFMDFTVEAGDLSGGNVTFALMHLGSGGGQVYASTAFPFRWRARNDH